MAGIGYLQKHQKRITLHTPTHLPTNPVRRGQPRPGEHCRHSGHSYRQNGPPPPGCNRARGCSTPVPTNQWQKCAHPQYSLDRNGGRRGQTRPSGLGVHHHQTREQPDSYTLSHHRRGVRARRHKHAPPRVSRRNGAHPHRRAPHRPGRTPPCPRRYQKPTRRLWNHPIHQCNSPGLHDRA